MLIGEIIPELYRYLRNNPAAPERSLYDHVLVDEYQDLNKAEQAVVDLLSTSASLCVVGDDDQSLYSFKHAHPEGIRTFPQTHTGCTDHALVECYRCPTGIVAIANALIGHNVDREPLQLVPVSANGPGEMWVVQYPDVAREAQAIAAFVDDQINKHGRHPGEILVLAQRRTIGNPIHAALWSAFQLARVRAREGFNRGVMVLSHIVLILKCPICKQDSGNRITSLPHREQHFDPMFCKECGTDFIAVFTKEGSTLVVQK